MPAEVELGREFTIDVLVTHELGQRYELEALEAPGDFELGAVDRKRSESGRSATTIFKVRAQAFALGELTTPDLTLVVSDAQGQVGSLVAHGAAITVKGVLDAKAEQEGADLVDVPRPFEAMVRTWRLLWALGTVLVLAALGWAFLRWRAAKRRAQPAAPVAPAKPLRERTLALLDALRAEDLPAQGKVREFYFRLSEIVRGYLGERYGFEALESTSTELLEALRGLHTPGLSMDDVRRFTEDADIARYARAALDPDVCKGSLELAYRVVSTTTVTVQGPNVR